MALGTFTRRLQQSHDLGDLSRFFFLGEGGKRAKKSRSRGIVTEAIDSRQFTSRRVV